MSEGRDAKPDAGASDVGPWDARISFKQVREELRGMRRKSGMSLDKLARCTELQRASVVRYEVENYLLDGDVAARNVMTCILGTSDRVRRSIDEQHRIIVGAELNVAAEPNNLVDRQSKVLVTYPALLQGDRYEVASNNAYDAVTAYLIELDRSPCRDAEARAEDRLLAIKQSGDSLASQMAATLVSLLSQHRTFEDAQRDAEELIRAVPRAAAIMLIRGYRDIHPLVIAKSILTPLVRSAYGSWRESYLIAMNTTWMPNATTALRVTDAVDDVQGDGFPAYITRPVSSLIAIMAADFERRDAWATVLSPPYGIDISTQV